MPDPYQTYCQLVERVETFGQAIRQRYPTQITCHAGCDGCCYQPFTIFPVEVHHMAQAVAALSPEAREQLRQHVHQADDPWQVADQPPPCVLLRQARCSLYEGRPLICRMQGLPLASEMIERPDGLQRDCCPLNFPDMALDEIDAAAVYNLDVVNQTLVAINHLFVQTYQVPAQRLSIRQALLHAFDALAANPPEAS